MVPEFQLTHLSLSLWLRRMFGRGLAMLAQRWYMDVKQRGHCTERALRHRSFSGKGLSCPNHHWTPFKWFQLVKKKKKKRFGEIWRDPQATKISQKIVIKTLLCQINKNIFFENNKLYNMCIYQIHTWMSLWLWDRWWVAILQMVNKLFIRDSQKSMSRNMGLWLNCCVFVVQCWSVPLT